MGTHLYLLIKWDYYCQRGLQNHLFQGWGRTENEFFVSLQIIIQLQRNLALFTIILSFFFTWMVMNVVNLCLKQFFCIWFHLICDWKWQTVFFFSFGVTQISLGVFDLVFEYVEQIRSSGSRSISHVCVIPLDERERGTHSKVTVSIVLKMFQWTTDGQQGSSATFIPQTAENYSPGNTAHTFRTADTSLDFRGIFSTLGVLLRPLSC